jgi:hypothetical protein
VTSTGNPAAACNSCSRRIQVPVEPLTNCVYCHELMLRPAKQAILTAIHPLSLQASTVLTQTDAAINFGAAVYPQTGVQAHAHATTNDASNRPQQAVPAQRHNGAFYCTLQPSGFLEPSSAFSEPSSAASSTPSSAFAERSAAGLSDSRDYGVHNHPKQLHPHTALQFIQHRMG